ncbi:MAG: sulfatase-like hydrolase/transferase [Bacteroidales bacterium]|nr:sulfatase-like hydrolase/transferase [Bacteroidales bacterium]
MKKISINNLLHRLAGISDYWSCAFLYMIIVMIIKLIEWKGMPVTEGVGMGNILIRALTYNLIVVSWIIIAGAVIHALLKKILPRGVWIISVIWFSLLVLMEIGLAIYAAHNGYMLDSELWVRPLKETVMSIVGAVGITMPIAGIIGVILGMGFFSTVLMRHKAMVLSVLPISLIFALLSLIFMPSHLIEYKAFSYINSRTQFFTAESVKYFKNLLQNGKIEEGSYQMESDEKLLADFLSYHPQWRVDDINYPLERDDNTPDVLSPYFKPAAGKVDVVLLLVESLGNEFMGTGIMPFTDSLAGSGLYWSNCLSTAIRSYAALPALTGSVGGPRGFQFGTMPAFNSMVAIFNQNEYQTNYFYAGYLTFDCIYEYLTAQHVSYMAPFFKRFKSNKETHLGNYWGYSDGVMLDKTIEELQQQTQPHFSMITTITMHEPLDLYDKNVQQQYDKKVKENKNLNLFGKTEKLSAAVYTDDCIRKWMYQYSQLPNFKNTIFIIVGDHSSGTQKNGDKLSFHHVPLIIWSPLLKQARQFKSIVTHNDLAPSLCQLMKNTYHLSTPAKVHWLGEGLDTSSVMHKQRDMLIVSYNREIRELVTGEYYYQTANQWEKEQVYKIEDDLGLTPVDNPALLQQCGKKLDVYKYIYKYTYYNNKLTAHPLYPQEIYTNIITYKRASDLHYQTPDYKPSEKGDKIFELFPETSLPQSVTCKKVKLTLIADVLVHDSLFQDHYPFLIFDFKGAEEVWECDYITKFLNSEVIQKDSTYHLEVSKYFTLAEDKNNLCSVCLLSPGHDSHWVPNTRVTVKNALLKVDYAK